VRKTKKKFVFDGITDAQVDMRLAMSTAAHIARHDIECGFSTLAVEIAAMTRDNPERAETLCASCVTFLLGIADEVRYAVVKRMIDMSPGMAEPDWEAMSAKHDYANRVAKFPNTAKEIFDDAKNSSREN